MIVHIVFLFLNYGIIKQFFTVAFVHFFTIVQTWAEYLMIKQKLGSYFSSTVGTVY